MKLKNLIAFAALVAAAASSQAYTSIVNGTAGSDQTVTFDIASGSVDNYLFSAGSGITGVKFDGFDFSPNLYGSWSLSGLNFSGKTHILSVQGTGSYFAALTYISTTIPNAPVASVPEPETYAMFLAGLGIMGAVARRRSKQV